MNNAKRQKLLELLKKRANHQTKKYGEKGLIPVAGMVIRTKPLQAKPHKRKRRPGLPINLAARRDGVPNAPNVLKGDTLWRRDGTVLPRAAVEEMKRLRGR